MSAHLRAGGAAPVGGPPAEAWLQGPWAQATPHLCSFSQLSLAHSFCDPWVHLHQTRAADSLVRVQVTHPCGPGQVSMLSEFGVLWKGVEGPAWPQGSWNPRPPPQPVPLLSCPGWL